MLTIKPTPDYDAILRWNAGKDEAFLFQWAGTTAYCYPLTKKQLMRQSAKDGVTVFMAYENEVPIGTMELCDIDPVQKTGRICRVLFAEETRGKGLAHRAFLPFAKRLLRNWDWKRSPCVYTASICLPSAAMSGSVFW